MRTSIALLLIGSMLTPGCATVSSWRDAVPKTATLEVSNRTGETRQIVVRGAREGSVAAGTRRRFRWLAPGKVQVSALAKEAQTETYDVELTPGAVSTWALGTSTPIPATLGDLRITNQLPRTVAVTVDGKPRGVVLAGDTRVLRDIEAGDTTITALVAETGLHLSHTAQISDTVESQWLISAPTGEAIVVNDSAEYVSLLLDGRDVGQILPGDQLTVSDIPAGTHTFTAIGVGTSVTRNHEFTLQPERAYSWSLSSERGTIEIVNGSGEALLLKGSSDGADQELASGERLTLRDVAPGARGLKASGVTSLMPYEETLNVRPGQEVRWHVQPIATTIRVENTTRRPLELYVDATWQSRLDPGSNRIVANLGPGEHELVAVSPDGRTVFRHTAPPSPLRSSSWRIEAEQAGCRVDNTRPAAVMVFVDGRGLGEVPANTTLTFTGLEVGTRMLEAVDLSNGRTLKQIFTLTPDTEETPVATWLLSAPTGTLVVSNGSSEPLLTEGELTATSEALAPGATTTFRLPTGPAAVRLIGETSGVAHSRDFQVEKDVEVTWKVGATTGHVSVTNRLKDTLKLSIDGVDMGVVPAGTSFRSKALPAGPHTLVAIESLSGHHHTARRIVGPQDEARWVLQPEVANIVISNDSSEAISVNIDGRPYGRVEAESRSGISGLLPGDRQIDMLGLRSGWHRSMSLTLLSGGTEVVELQAPMAILVIDNQSDEPMTVVTEGMPPQSVKPGTETPITIAAGRQRLTATGQASGQTQAFDVVLAVGQSHHLTIKSARARLLVINRSQSTQTIRLSDRVLGEVPPEGRALFDDLIPAHWWLTAYDASGALTHSEHRSVTAGETRSWVLSQKLPTKTNPQSAD